jgi:hypothetical protein
MNRAYIAEMKKELRGHEEQLMRFRGTKIDLSTRRDVPERSGRFKLCGMVEVNGKARNLSLEAKKDYTIMNRTRSKLFQFTAVYPPRRFFGSHSD